MNPKKLQAKVNKIVRLNYIAQKSVFENDGQIHLYVEGYRTRSVKEEEGFYMERKLVLAELQRSGYTLTENGIDSGVYGKIYCYIVNK